MKLAFVLYQYFPFGGLTRDMMRIAEACYARGAEIHVHTLKWVEPEPTWIRVHRYKRRGWSSHVRNVHFTQDLQAAFAEDPVDLIVGFNKMPGLDVYYAADGCYEQRVSELYGCIYRMGARYKHFSAYERDVFDASKKTEILMISEPQIPIFQKFYATPSERMHLLPPGISRDRIAPDNATEIRAEFRREFGIADDELLMLMVGSGFKTKGLDRAITAFECLPKDLRRKVKFFVVGKDEAKPFEFQAKQAGLKRRFKMFDGRDDVSRFFLGADLLLHPARHENTGTVLLEAIISGLPVLVTDICGYAHYVSDHKMGVVMPSPFNAYAMVQSLRLMLQQMPEQREEYQRRGAEFARTQDIYDMPEHAADFIMNLKKVEC